MNNYAPRNCDHDEEPDYTCWSCAYSASLIGDTDPKWNIGILEQLRKENKNEATTN